MKYIVKKTSHEQSHLILLNIKTMETYCVSCKKNSGKTKILALKAHSQV